MDTEMLIEVAGYIGSAVVVVSFLMASVVKLRVINSIGCVISATYSMIIHSYPMALMNTCLLLINLYYLMRMRNQEKHYDLLSVSSDDSFLEYILTYYKEDIKACFPEIHLDLSKINKAFIVCCDAVPAGIMLGNDRGGTMDITLDYSTPQYRDYSIGEYLINKLPTKGIRTLTYTGSVENHTDYLQKMGFQKQDGIYQRKL